MHLADMHGRRVPVFIGLEFNLFYRGFEKLDRSVEVILKAIRDFSHEGRRDKMFFRTHAFYQDYHVHTDKTKSFCYRC